MSTGKVEQRIGHSFVINVKNRDQFEAKIYVNGKRDKQTVKIQEYLLTVIHGKSG